MRISVSSPFAVSFFRPPAAQRACVGPHPPPGGRRGVRHGARATAVGAPRRTARAGAAPAPDRVPDGAARSAVRGPQLSAARVTRVAARAQELGVDGVILEQLRASCASGAFLGTRPNISESYSELSTRVPHCITGAVAGRSFEYPPEHQRIQ